MLSLHVLQNCGLREHAHAAGGPRRAPLAGPVDRNRSRGADAADAGTRQSLRPLRAGHVDPTAAQMIQMAAGDTNVGSTPRSGNAPSYPEASLARWRLSPPGKPYHSRFCSADLIYRPSRTGLEFSLPAFHAAFIFQHRSTDQRKRRNSNLRAMLICEGVYYGKFASDRCGGRDRRGVRLE
jgi:hypothetical protein